MTQLAPIEAPAAVPTRGEVTDLDGMPVEGAEVFLAGGTSKGIALIGAGRSDTAGRFDVSPAVEFTEGPEPPARPFVLLAYRPGSRLCGVLLQAPSRQPPGTSHRFVLRPALPAIVRVVAPDGNPVAGARLEVGLLDGLVGVPPELAVRLAAETDADGRATLWDFASESPGSVRV
jgi:hypothetical protein